MLVEKQKQTEEITVDQYLKEELTSEIKYEFIDGQIYAMSGASENHNHISGNIFGELYNHLKTLSCHPFTSDMKLKQQTEIFVILMLWWFVRKIMKIHITKLNPLY